MIAASIPLRVIPPLVSTALLMVGSDVLGSLLPLRFSAMGYSPGVIGLFATAEALGFWVGCLYAHKIIAPVGLERAYAAFAGMKAVAILGLHFAGSAPTIVPLRFVIGLDAAGLAIVVESWLNALVPNEQGGRVLTIYVLVYGLFFGTGQLLGQNLNVLGPELLFMAGIATILALVPMVAIDVRAPMLPQAVHLEILQALRTSPVSVLACLLNGLILTAFTTVGPLFGERIGFDQRHSAISPPAARSSSRTRRPLPKSMPGCPIIASPHRSPSRWAIPRPYQRLSRSPRFRQLLRSRPCKPGRPPSTKRCHERAHSIGLDNSLMEARQCACLVDIGRRVNKRFMGTRLVHPSTRTLSILN